MCSECCRDPISQQRWITRSWALYVGSIEWINLLWSKLCSLCSHGDVHYLKVSHRLYIGKPGLYLNLTPRLFCCWLVSLKDLIRSVIVENFSYLCFFTYCWPDGSLKLPPVLQQTPVFFFIKWKDLVCGYQNGFPEETVCVCLICSYIELYYTVCLVIYSRITDWALFIPFHINYKEVHHYISRLKPFLLQRRPSLSFFSLNLLWIL